MTVQVVRNGKGWSTAPSRQRLPLDPGRTDDDELADEFGQPTGPGVAIARSYSAVFQCRLSKSISGLAYDREVKIPTYARYGVPEVWIADLNNAAVEIYRRPTADRDASVEWLDDPEAVVSPRLLPQLRLRVKAMVG